GPLRARERVEVLHDLLLAEVLDLDRAVADAGALQRGDDVGEREAVAHEDRLGAFGGAHDVDDAFRFRGAVGDVVPGGGVAGERGVLGRGARVRYGAGGRISLGRQDGGKRSVVPVDEASLRAEVGG